MFGAQHYIAAATHYNHVRGGPSLTSITLEVKYTWFFSSTCDMACTKSKQKRMIVGLCTNNNQLGWCPVQALSTGSVSRQFIRLLENTPKYAMDATVGRTVGRTD